MALIDLDKFVASFITEMKECSQMRNFSIPRCIKKALEDQCLEYKDSKIVKSQRRIAKKQLEQTVMDYEKAFKEAYERASLRFGTNVANELFLEYKESKEERTRRKLIEFFSDWSKTKSYCWGIRVTDIMDWLEKQGEQKPTEWSEEDEGFRNLLIAIMKFEHPEGVFEANGITPFCGTISVHRVIDWLKSLKQRYT